MDWDHWRARLIDARQGHEFNRWDTLGLVLFVGGLIGGLVGLIFFSYPGLLGFFAIGFLILTRHMPGSA